MCVTVDRFDRSYSRSNLMCACFSERFLCVFLYSARWCVTIIWLSRVCVVAFARMHSVNVNCCITLHKPIGGAAFAV